MRILAKLSSRRLSFAQEQTESPAQLWLGLGGSGSAEFGAEKNLWVSDGERAETGSPWRRQLSDKLSSAQLAFFIHSNEIGPRRAARPHLIELSSRARSPVEPGRS